MLRAMPPLLAPIIASAGLGALIGLIRQWRDQNSRKNPDVDMGGIRTYTFWAILGAVSALASRDYAPWTLPVLLLVVSAHQIVMRWKTHDETSPGGTSFAATLLTIMIGALIAWEQTESGVVLAALTMVVLGSKKPVHEWTDRFTAADIRATLQFVAVTGVILPLVPDRDMGPYGGFNPFSTWLMVVLISGLGFASYVAMRIIGERAGIVVSSLLGGLASSTATTLAFSRRSKEDPDRSAHYALALSIASGVMLPRVLVVVGLVNRELALGLVLPFALMSIPPILHGLWFWLRRPDAPENSDALAIQNPLKLTTAIKFAALYAVFAFIVEAASQHNLQDSLLPLSFVSGLTNMEAISLSMANHENGASGELAVQAIVIAAVANSISKIAIAVFAGDKRLRPPALLSLGATAAIGGAAAFLL